MNPKFFVDIKNNGAFHKNISASAAMFLWGKQIIGLLHHIFKENPERFAIAFPVSERSSKPFNAIRVFSETPEEMDMLAKHFISHMTSYLNQIACQSTVISNINIVPDDFSGKWISYERFRVPSRQANSKTSVPRRFNRMMELERLKQTGEGFSFTLKSKSNGNVFSLSVKKVFSPTNFFKENECLPDSYGLSVKTRPFFLPAIEL